MRRASILSWKHLASVIHPPLPINVRDSQRLLSLLNASFNQALDREHPRVSPAERNTTEDHLHSILSSPHFARKSLRARSTIAFSTAATTTKSPIDEIKKSIRLFEEHIAAGTASLDLAKQCLHLPSLLLNRSRTSAQVVDLDAIKSIGLASILLNWLWSLGNHKLSAILTDKVFLERLMPLLVIEGQSEQACFWLNDLQSAEDGVWSHLSGGRGHLVGVSPRHPVLTLLREICSERKIANIEDFLRSKYELERTNPTAGFWKYIRYGIAKRNVLLHLVASTDRYGLGLEEAMRVFLRFQASLSPGKGWQDRRQLLNHSGRYIVHAILSCADTTRLDRRVYDRFFESTPRWSQPLLFFEAILLLRHPSEPSANAMCSFFRNHEGSGVPSEAPAFRRRVLRSGLLAADLLLSSKADDAVVEAKLIMDILEKYYSSELGKLKNVAGSVPERTGAATESLELLENSLGNLLFAT